MEIVNLRIRNWDKYQHYKNRSPSWIKLYNTLLDDLDFSRLDEANQRHCIFLMLLVSRLAENKLPISANSTHKLRIGTAEWLSRRIDARSEINLEALLKAGFLEGYSNSDRKLLAVCLNGSKHNAKTEERRDRDREEKNIYYVPEAVEKTVEKEKKPTQKYSDNFKTKKIKHSEEEHPLWKVFIEFWEMYPRKIDRHRCWSSFKTLKPDRGKLLEALKHFKEFEWNGRSNEFIPHPRTWLNARHYEEKIEKPASQPVKKCYPDWLVNKMRVAVRKTSDNYIGSGMDSNSPQWILSLKRNCSEIGITFEDKLLEEAKR